MFTEKFLGCFYKEFKQILEHKEVIRSLATGSNAGNKGRTRIKKGAQGHLADF